ncbi:MAG: hypothetical protein QM764_24300 [Chitinophagaceae bacterium]
MIKKIITILLIFIYLLNFVGYNILFDYFISQTNKEIIRQLDKGDYSESQLIEIKIPLYLPYYYSWSDYERFDGEIELNNIHYNYVKRKVLNDTLHLLCLPNYDKTELYKAKHQFASKETDNTSPGNSKKGTASLAKSNNSDTEYDRHIFQFHFLCVATHSPHKNSFNSNLSSCFISTPTKPPELSYHFWG